MECLEMCVKGFAVDCFRQDVTEFCHDDTIRSRQVYVCPTGPTLRCVQVLRALKTRGLPLGDVGHSQGQGSSSSAPGHKGSFLTGERMSASRVKEEEKIARSALTCPASIGSGSRRMVCSDKKRSTAFSFYFCVTFWGRKTNFTNSKTLVGVATDRHARHACLRFFSLYFSVFFLSLPKKH